MDDSREVIELVNKLQSHFKSTGLKYNIELPQIVVVGAQSSGKSSVLDGLVGFSILPRGSKTVTKCPIIVQLITISESEEEGIEFGEDPDAIRIKDQNEVRDRISKIMESNGGAIADRPIIIRVFSPNVVTLTVVDLPGIKRIASEDEPSDTEELTINLSRKYISEKNAIILAVSPANYEICNSDGLILAKKADPRFERTIGVLTKLDLMDEGTNARELLNGTSKDVRVKLGMIGLVNRSQKDIDNNVSVEEQLEKEKHFLNKNYCGLAHVSGVPFLRKRLQELLVQHIRKCLPEMLNKLENLLSECEQRLADIPNVMDKKDKYAFVYKIIRRFENDMCTEIEGSARSPEYKYLYGGIKIKDIFEKRFAKDMETAGKNSNDSITEDMVQTAFRNSGSYDSMFVYPEAVFRKLAQDQVRRIKSPALKCADRVCDEILKIADRNLRDKRNAFDHFPELKKSIKSVVTSMLNNKLDEVKKYLTDYIRIQSSVVFSLDQHFLRKIADLRRTLEKHLNKKEDEEELGRQTTLESSLPNPASHNIAKCQDQGQGSRSISANVNRVNAKVKDSDTTKLIKQMVKHYFDLMKAQTQDYIPKLVADRLITQFSSDRTVGSLADQLRATVLEKHEELAKLPANLTERRERDVQLRMHLKEVISDIKEIHQIEDQDESGYSDQENSDGTNCKNIHDAPYYNLTVNRHSRNRGRGFNSSLLSLL